MTSHNIAVLSNDPVATRFPFLPKAIDLISFVCPLNSFIEAPVFKFHKTSFSEIADAKSNPSGLNLIETTVLVSLFNCLTNWFLKIFHNIMLSETVYASCFPSGLKVTQFISPAIFLIAWVNLPVSISHIITLPSEVPAAIWLWWGLKAREVMLDIS